MSEKPFFVLLTNRCNLACPHCYNELDPLKMVKTKTEDPLTRDRLQFLFSELARQGYKKGFFSGGEALLRPDAVDILGDARKEGLKTALFTNGHVFTEELIGRLVEAGLDEVRISLNEMVWIRNRQQYEGVLARQTKWVTTLRKAGIGVGIIYIISKLNVGHVTETHDRIRALGAGMKVQPLHLPEKVKGFNAAASSRIEAGEWDDLITELEEITARTDYEAENSYGVYGNPWKLLRYLRFVRDVYVLGIRPDFCPTGPILLLDSDGWFHPCLFRFDLVCGNISNDDEVRGIRERVDANWSLSDAHCFREECLSAFR